MNAKDGDAVWRGTEEVLVQTMQLELEKGLEDQSRPPTFGLMEIGN